MKNKRPHGTLRRSQVLTTYGPGAMVDLPTHSVLIAGLEEWSLQGREPIYEPRLVRTLEHRLGRRPLELFTPPAASDAPDEGQTGITAWIFPQWFVGAYVDREQDADGVRSRPLVHLRKLENGKYQKQAVVPIRFVQACPRGHISDIDWYAFVHRLDPTCRRDLWVDEHGTTGDLHNVVIRCACGEQRRMSSAEHRPIRDAEVSPEATDREDAPLGYCEGRRPWLGAKGRHKCGGDEGPEPNRLLIRSASNTWFSDTVSVISIPDTESEVARQIDAAWHLLGELESAEDLAYARKKLALVRHALGELTDAEAWKAIERKRQGGQDEDESFKRTELETLLAASEELGADTPDGDFHARRLDKTPDVPGVERVVLVHRLREVMALVGFTRFEPPIAEEDGELRLAVHRAELSRVASWLPAIENRGEGVFIAFDAAAIEAWQERAPVKERWDTLRAGHDRWRRRNKKPQHKLPGLPYILLHSLSHLLLTTVALDCGYATTAIRERIYAIPNVGYGILLYTATSDAEGTLGGLVEVGRHIEQHLRVALERGRFCSHDPVCSDHSPDKGQEERYLHGAACHACLLLSETSCEQRNVLLDRALVVPTVSTPDAAFFSDLSRAGALSEPPSSAAAPPPPPHGRST